MTANWAQRLAGVLPPPAVPVDVPTPAEWKKTEARLGFRLADDYRQFVATYGAGGVGDELYLLGPFSRSALNIVEEGLALAAHDRAIAREYPATLPYQVFPENPGLFPFASTGNGDCCYWEVVDGIVPDDATIVVREVRAGPGHVWVYGGGTCRFLYELVTGAIEVPPIPRRWFQPPRFIPIEER